MSSKRPPPPPVPPQSEQEASAGGNPASADPLVFDPEVLLSAGDLMELSGSLEEVTGPSLRPNGEEPAVGAVEGEAEDEYEVVLTERIFGRFELLMEMSQGGMATLFLARIRGPERFEKFLAIKKIHPHLARRREFVNMFLDEARLAALIQNPNVATIFDMGKVDKSYFLAMEYVHGQNLTDILRSVIRHGRSLAWPVVARIIADASVGLHAAHELKSPEGVPLNVVHRDVSPQNVLISYEGHIKVVDFGIAYAAGRIGQTDSGVLKGKVAYMSPEQASGEKLDRRSDIFSLGILLFEAICQQRLFREDSDAASWLKVREAIVPPPRTINPQIPVELERIILKALAKDKSERYSTAAELAEALEELLVSEGQGMSHQKLSKMMHQLFYDKKRIKDKQIKQALKVGYDKAIKAAGMAGATGTNLEVAPLDSGQVYRRARRSLISVIFLAALVAVVTVTVVVYFLIRPTGGDSKRAPAPPTSTKPPMSAGPGHLDASARPSSSTMAPTRTDSSSGPKKRNMVRLRSMRSKAGEMGPMRRIRPRRTTPMREMASGFRDLKDNEPMKPQPRPRMATDFRDLDD